MREVLQKVMSLPSRIDAGRRAVDMLEKVVRLEREAYLDCPRSAATPRKSARS